MAAAIVAEYPSVQSLVQVLCCSILWCSVALVCAFRLHHCPKLCPWIWIRIAFCASFLIGLWKVPDTRTGCKTTARYIGKRNLQFSARFSFLFIFFWRCLVMRDPSLITGYYCHIQGVAVPTLDCTQSLSFLVHSNWETGASEWHSRAENGTLLTPVSRAVAHLARSSLSITKRKERDCVQSIPIPFCDATRKAAVSGTSSRNMVLRITAPFKPAESW